MAAGQYYDPRRLPQSGEDSPWTLLTHPDFDRVHIWVRSVGALDVTVTRLGGEWWEIEIKNQRGKLVKEFQASSGVAAFMKVQLWAMTQKGVAA